MREIREYECPRCGGRVEYDPKSGLLVCPYCGAEFEPEAFAEKLAKAQPVDTESPAAETVSYARVPGEQLERWNPSEEPGLTSYICESCGGEIIADVNKAALRCPYCDNPVLVPRKLEAQYKPNYVIPFRFSKEQAIEAFRQHASAHKLVPDIFSAKSHLEEVQGIYLPYWLISCRAKANYAFEASTTESVRSGDRIYTTERIYDVKRQGALNFEQIPVEASTKHSRALLESLEPYDFSQLQPFNEGYLAGFLADKYDLEAEASEPRAKQRIQKTMETAFNKTLSDYERFSLRDMELNLDQMKFEYALLPVWILNTRWQNELYHFAMNGQTGKLIGDLPEDRSKVRKARLKYGLIYALLALLLGYFLLPYLVRLFLVNNLLGYLL
ncbi:MAG: hypothetical protein Q4P65_04260 [Eubacteriales bacterium]|nr:hypothetical protein [Eubacteriales bacterium]